MHNSYFDSVKHPADPSPLPYHPKTNYLAPRPNFLYWKTGRMKLVQSFDEEMDVITKGAQSNLIQTVPQEAADEHEELEDRTRVSEYKIRMNAKRNHLRAWSFTWSKALPLLFIVAIACLFGSERHSVITFLGLFVAVILLTTQTVFVCPKKKKQTAVIAQKGLPPKRVYSVSGSCDNFGVAKGSPDQNVPIGLGMTIDSGPSDVGSYCSPGSGQERIKWEKRVDSLSHDKMLRRDSPGSLSAAYGSYTTLERISVKKGGRDKEAMTPVRRSSRIRNKLASPREEE